MNSTTHPLIARLSGSFFEPRERFRKAIQSRRRYLCARIHPPAKYGNVVETREREKRNFNWRLFTRRCATVEVCSQHGENKSSDEGNKRMEILHKASPIRIRRRIE